MSTFHKGIQIWEQAVTEFDSSSDIFRTVAVHPWFGDCIVNIGRMD